MKNMKTRYVIIDDGYAQQEHYVRVKVIDSKMMEPLFGGEKTKSLLVEYPDKTRKWIAYWKELESSIL